MLQHRPALTATAKVIAMPASLPIRGKPYGKLVKRECGFCGLGFLYNAADVARGFGKFCSRPCLIRGRQHGRAKRSLADRYWEKVIRRGDDECWGWSGFKHGGYGRLRADTNAVGAHRVSYEIHFGPIPDSMFVCHHCDNPECSNPRHLFLGTSGDNNRDCTKKGRRARGERGGSAKLTAASVRRIRQQWSAGGVRLKDLAERFGVSVGAIEHVVTNRTWRHIT